MTPVSVHRVINKNRSISPYRNTDTANIREWTYKDILRMPTTDQEEWKHACCEELESLHRWHVYELVDPPKGRKVIKN